MKESVLYFSIIAIFAIQLVIANNERPSATKRKLPKDPLYITELDLENLYDEWEESDDEPLPFDELPVHKREMMQPPSNNKIFDSLVTDPQQLLKASKKGKTVMAFATVANNPTKEETDLLTQRWQVGLTNSHMKCERFVVSDDRAIFVFSDGSLAYEAKDYFLEQPELKDFAIDNQVWHGKGYPAEVLDQAKASIGSDEL